MPARIYLCPIIGSGTEDDPQRAAITDDPAVTRCRAVISVDRNTGIKRFGWTICMVEANSWAGVDAIQGTVRISQAGLDSLSSSTLRTKLKGEVGTKVALSAGDTVRTLIRKLVQTHYPHADEEAVL